MTLIVVSDQHLGTGASLGDRLADQRGSWERVCVTAAEVNATVIHAGDVFHARRPGMPEMDAFQAGLEILREGGCTLLGVAGNHDVSEAGKPTAFEVACSGYDAHVFREPIVVETADGPVGLLPWMPPRMNARDTGAALMIVAEDLAEQGAKILVGHWALSSASLPTGLPVLELAEPILDSHRLAELFEVVLMGHIHKPQVVIGERNEWPHVLHTGPLSRGNFGEAEIRTGAWQLAQIPTGLGDSFIGASWIELPDRAFIVIDVDVRTATLPTGVIEHEIDQHQVRDAIVRVSWRQTADQVIDTESIRTLLGNYGAHFVDALTPIIERQVSTRSAGVTEETSPHQSWDAYFAPQRDELAEDVADLANEAAHERIARVA